MKNGKNGASKKEAADLAMIAKWAKKQSTAALRIALVNTRGRPYGIIQAELKSRKEEDFEHFVRVIMPKVEKVTAKREKEDKKE